MNKKMLGLILSGALSLGMVGCSSEEAPTTEPARDFAITDGQLYEDIETLENGRVYVVPTGNWEVTKLEDGNSPVQRIIISSDKDGNEEIIYNQAFNIEAEENEKVTITMAGEGMQLYFKEVK